MDWLVKLQFVVNNSPPFLLIVNMKSIIRFLLEKPNQNTDHLSSLCFLETNIIDCEKLEALIKFGTLVGDYMLQLVGSKLHLWW